MPRRVLIVEDQPMNRQVVESMLRHLGIAFDSAADGREALAHIVARSYDAVLMDCHMPVMDGYETTRAIRLEDGPNRTVPIVAVTANALPENRVRCGESGMDAFIVKPVRVEVLAEVLNELWGEPPVTPSEVAATSAEDPGMAELAGRIAYLEGLGGPDLVEELVEIFNSETGKAVENLGRLTLSGDRDAVVRAAHSIKGSAANMGAVQLRRIAHELELSAASRAMEEIEALRGAVAAEFERVCRDLSALRTCGSQP